MAMQFLKSRPGQPLVLDLGGNIGLFSLLAARAHAAAQVYTYEPGPPNYRLFETNCLLKRAALAERIHLRKEAVAGRTCQTQWCFDDLNPGGSGLFATAGSKFPVQIRAFEEVVRGLPAPVDLVKIDIEGAEYSLLAETPREAWEKVGAISLELHDDPSGAVSQGQFLDQMRNLGFKIEEESVCSMFLHR